MGFAKAFGYLQNSPITKNISRMAGLAWLLVLVLFLFSSITFITRKESWPYIALIAVVISQVLISMVWKDARFGTIANIIICIVAIIGLANVNLEKSLRKQVNALLMVTRPQPKIIDQEMLNGLPMAVQKWLQASGVIGHEMAQTIRLKQEGRMCTKQGGKWVNFSAEQYFNTLESDFIWHANVEMMPLLFMQGVDQFHNGQGDMQIKLLGIKSVASAKGTAEVNQGTLVRYLSEICWFPSAALNSNIRWVQTGPASARADIEVGGTKATGEFFFDDNGIIRSFEAMRFGEFDGKSSLEKWQINVKHTAIFHGIQIPDQSTVTWKLPAGDFTWLDLRVTAIDYNIMDQY
jgi:hypothetical protein